MKHVGFPRRVGLARALSKLGYCSRSEAFRLIRAGRVRLNGRLRFDPETPVYLKRDRIEIDGHLLEAHPKIYLMLNKPRGVITTASDEKGRDTVYQLLDQQLPWVAPVGRLDKASEGLLLLTNEPEWSARVLAPETHLEKIYHAQIAAVADGALTGRMTKGVKEGNDFLRAKSARILRGGARNTWLEIVLDEGKNRHIRRMLAQFGIEVIRLVRVAIGPLRLGELPKGSARQLTAEEKQAIDRSMEESQTAATQFSAAGD
jgi:23S rRNA pseudouridine2605 synthase